MCKALCSVTQLRLTLCNPWIAAHQASLSLTISQNLPKFIFIASVMAGQPAISSSDALFSFCPQSFPASGTFPMCQLFVSDDHQSFQRAFRVDFP